jgi:hypothetical protein
MILLGDQVKKDENGGARGTEGEDIYIEFLQEKL